MTKNLSDVLKAPIAWKHWATDPAVHAVLADMQSNILKGHGRDHTGNVFVSFKGMRPEAVAHLLRALAALVNSALDQLRGAEAFKAARISGGRVTCLFLSAGGYRALGLPQRQWPADPSFQAGMRGQGSKLADPPPDAWGEGAWSPGNPTPDAMILVADDDEDAVTRDLERVEGLLNGSGAKVLGVERGKAYRRKQDPRNPKGEGMENFGYADGRSQPLFLQEDVDAEPHKTHWNPSFPAAQFVIADPNGRSPFSCGSYFVFRKLDQNVAGFKGTEDQLGNALNNGERAGAMVVGRFEDGTPVTSFAAAQGGSPPNDFNYSEDADGRRCPFQAHIRKTNPRGDIQRKFGAPEAAERNPVIARRGITYGVRRQNGTDGDFQEDDRPGHGVGLLFMAYMANVAAQFEFIQASWANNVNFVVPQNGVDPVIGQAPAGQPVAKTKWRDGYLPSPRTVEFDFHGFVTLKGGEYFFAPSLSFLHTVGLPVA
jgi:deferrochelatase/peroxidase EfeB